MTCSSSHVDIVSGKYVHYFDRPDIPIREQGGELKKIVIGRGAWIANNATVLESIGEGCVITAGVAVVSPCEPMGIYAGNPARGLRRRGEINPNPGGVCSLFALRPSVLNQEKAAAPLECQKRVHRKL
jgi:acetyltransferase-like isoleucine patch superfamily enzyme